MGVGVGVADGVGVGVADGVGVGVADGVGAGVAVADLVISKVTKSTSASLSPLSGNIGLKVPKSLPGVTLSRG